MKYSIEACSDLQGNNLSPLKPPKKICILNKTTEKDKADTFVIFPQPLPDAS